MLSYQKGHILFKGFPGNGAFSPFPHLLFPFRWPPHLHLEIF